MQRAMYVTALVSLLISHCPVVGSESDAAKTYLVRASIRDVYPAGSMPQGAVLADPAVMVVENREANFNVGGEAAIGSHKVPFGTSMTVKVEPTGGKKVRVSGAIDISTVNTPDADIAVRDSSSVHFEKVIVCGKRVRICMSKSAERQRWFELLVDVPGNESLDNHATAKTSKALSVGPRVEPIPEVAHRRSAK